MGEDYYYCLDCCYGTTSEVKADEHEDDNPDHIVVTEEPGDHIIRGYN